MLDINMYNNLMELSCTTTGVPFNVGIAAGFSNIFIEGYTDGVWTQSMWDNTHTDSTLSPSTARRLLNPPAVTLTGTSGWASCIKPFDVTKYRNGSAVDQYADIIFAFYVSPPDFALLPAGPHIRLIQPCNAKGTLTDYFKCDVTLRAGWNLYKCGPQYTNTWGDTRVGNPTQSGIQGLSFGLLVTPSSAVSIIFGGAFIEPSYHITNAAGVFGYSSDYVGTVENGIPLIRICGDPRQPSFNEITDTTAGNLVSLTYGGGATAMFRQICTTNIRNGGSIGMGFLDNVNGVISRIILYATTAGVVLQVTVGNTSMKTFTAPATFSEGDMIVLRMSKYSDAAILGEAYSLKNPTVVYGVQNNTDIQGIRSSVLPIILALSCDTYSNALYNWEVSGVMYADKAAEARRLSPGSPIIMLNDTDGKYYKLGLDSNGLYTAAVTMENNLSIVAGV